MGKITYTVTLTDGREFETDDASEAELWASRGADITANPVDKTSTDCPDCRSGSTTFMTGTGEGTGQYRCNDCTIEFIVTEPFAVLDDEETDLLIEIAFGAEERALEQTLSERRDRRTGEVKLAEGRTSRVRDLLARTLESGAAERHFDEAEVRVLYERLSAKLYPSQ